MRLPPLKLRRGDRAELEARVRSNTVEARVAKRARMILLMADGESNRSIGATVGLHYNQVGLWRTRYEEFGLAGLLDEERPGRPAVYDHDDVLLLVKLVTEEPPAGAARWTMDALAEAMAEHGVPISASQAWRICKSLDLKPWQVESWMTSHDPDFWTKMQAKSRINPTKPAIPGKPARREFEYKRNGTAVLFAALDVHDGGIAGWVTDSTKSQNFVDFLGDLVRQTPKGLDLHCIADNLSAHKTGDVATFLAENPHVHIHYTPTHASWLNQVELFFSILERRLLRRGEFADVDDLADRMIAFIKDYNRRAASFRWTYDGRPLQTA